ncbi:hypothetical protein [Staphylococcus capitis]|uniref:hypothetical protein n=1 Tax=Staphylococcus capitis TaxID=29388 RepID=UPI00287B2233|nr:hypothetical protein [Staphylococcus capitis]MDS3999992.1 hypothetical protein [Staphylococcus capitis]
MSALLEELENKYGKCFRDVFSKFNGYDLTGYLEDEEHPYSKFELSLRYLMADFFSITTENVPENILTLFEPTNDKNKMYLLGNNKIYEFSIENFKISGNVAVSDFKDLESYEFSYEFEDGNPSEHNFFKPTVNAIHLVFKNRAVSLVKTDFSKYHFEDIVNYVIREIQ